MGVERAGKWAGYREWESMLANCLPTTCRRVRGERTDNTNTLVKNKPTKTQANSKHEKEAIKWTRTHWCFRLNNLCVPRQVQCVHANDARPPE